MTLGALSKAELLTYVPMWQRAASRSEIIGATFECSLERELPNTVHGNIPCKLKQLFTVHFWC